MNHRMTNRNWESVSYATHGAIPEEGEIILLRYPISDIPFVQGPEPSAFAISAHASGAITDVTTASMVNRPKLHHVLVLGVSHNKHAEMIDLEFMPIMAYTSRPRGYPNSRERWDPDHWMTHEASDTQRLHHLPIPAVAWTPAASPSSSAPVLSFGGWLNTRKSWLAMELVAHEIPEVQIWARSRKRAVLDGGVQQISHFLLVGIARGLKRIRSQTKADIATAGILALSGATSTRNSHVSISSRPHSRGDRPSSRPHSRGDTRSDTAATARARTAIATPVTPGKSWAQVVRDPPPPPGLAIGPSSTATVDAAMAPEYYNLWARYYGHDKFTGPYSPAALALLEAEHGEITTEDIDTAIHGDDGIDPISFWNTPTAPKAMRDIAQQHEKRMVEDKVRDWMVDAAFARRKGKGKRGGAVAEVEALDVGDIAVGEEAFKEV